MQDLLSDKRIITAIVILAIGITVALLRDAGVDIDQDTVDAAVEAVVEAPGAVTNR